MKVCSNCQTINADETQFCSKCGAQLGASQHGDEQSSYHPQDQPSCGTMGFSDAIRVCMKEKYASFEGRATRAEYWYFFLFYILVIFGAAIVGAIIGAVFSNGNDYVALYLTLIVYGIAILGLICPTISVLVRRLHDTGRSGWWYWISLIPYIGGIVILILTLLGSEEDDNEYGPYVEY